MIFEDDGSALSHIGVIRRSGRYPWGSGDNPYQRVDGFLDQIKQLRESGMSDTAIAKSFGMTTTDMRASIAIERNAKRRADEAMAMRLKEKRLSNVAIGERMGINESSVRSLLDPLRQARADVLLSTANMLRDQFKDKKYIDVGLGTEVQLGISKEKLNNAIAVLKQEGYEVRYVDVEQVGMPGKYTKVKVLVPPGTDRAELQRNRDQISMVQAYSNDYGRSYNKIQPPQSVSSKRVAVNYKEDGGDQMDGVIELRPGVKDISLGPNRYGQVRIAVDGTHYLKGMAIYNPDLPPGVDIRFNTNKSSTGNKLDAMKSLKDDEDNPFGAIVRQSYYKDSKGNDKLSAINFVGSKEGAGQEGAWGEWKRALSSQFLSKQSPQLAKQQLDKAFSQRKQDFDEIMSLTNPAVKKKLLDEFADNADKASVDLKAAALPRQNTRVILPVKSLKDDEIYAPGYRQGEKVVLVRHPHGGPFEIPELKVNNRHIESVRTLGDVRDAVGINAKVAARLSGADFDGDSVIVIPNNSGKVKTKAPLKGLKDFDPISSYPGYPGMKKLEGQSKQREMGIVSNLITDMSIKRAKSDEIARAVRHSMVVIDAEKHGLNWRQSYQDNGIAALKAKYQNGGSSTVISQAKSPIRIPERVDRKYSEGGPINPKTGERVYTPTGASYTKRVTNPRTGEVKETVVQKTTSVSKMSNTKDAHTLSSGTAMESIYANYANNLKSLANQARKESYQTQSVKYSPAAAKAYSKEVTTLQEKLNAALRNKPAERQAQLLARSEVNAKIKANPKMDKAEQKKLRTQAIIKARIRVGANKSRIDITPAEWAAIQAGAISHSKLTQILAHTDTDKVRKYAMPKPDYVVSDSKLVRARAMLSRGYDLAEIADQLGVPTSTLNDSLNR